ncbi:MAG: hypothetical protein ABEJ02_01290 [Candidatus Paceibacteria bacterium]
MPKSKEEKQEELLKRMEKIIKDIKEIKQEGFELRKDIKDKIDEAKAEAKREEIKNDIEDL